MKIVFIVNPKSGNGKSVEAIKAIKEYFNSLNIEPIIIYTKNVLEATMYSNYYASSDTIIYSVGGDGTLNGVVNGISNKDCVLGVVPTGTGNDFYKSLKDFNNDKVDLGKVNNRYFINIASIGLDADIANYANTLKEQLGPSKYAYIKGIFKNYFKYKPYNINIGGINKDITILAICNGKYYGNGFQIAPDAILNNGTFDIVNASDLNKITLIPLLLKLIRVKHLSDKHVEYYKTDKLCIESDIPINCNIDGEIIKNNKFDFSIEKEKMRIDNDDMFNVNKILKEKKLIK